MNFINIIGKTWTTGVLIFSLLAFKNKRKTIVVSTDKVEEEVDESADEKIDDRKLEDKK